MKKAKELRKEKMTVDKEKEKQGEKVSKQKGK